MVQGQVFLKGKGELYFSNFLNLYHFYVENLFHPLYFTIIL